MEETSKEKNVADTSLTEPQSRKELKIESDQESNKDTNVERSLSTEPQEQQLKMENDQESNKDNNVQRSLTVPQGQELKMEINKNNNSTTNKVEANPIEKLPSHFLAYWILLKLPIKSLLVCKSVCKALLSSIQDDWFVQLHMNQANNLVDPPVLLINDPGYMDDLPEERKKYHDKDFDILGVFQGLVVEQQNIQIHKFRVRNPATQQVLDLPQGHLARDQVIKLSWNSKKGQAKLASIYWIDGDQGELEYGFEILHIGVDNSWRLLRFKPRPHCYFIPDEDDAIHFYEVSNGGDLVVRSFDVQTEKFMEENILRGVHSDLIHYFRWNNCFALGFVKEGVKKLEVWILEEFIKENVEEKYHYKWSEKKIFELKFLSEDQYVDKRLKPAYCVGDKVWFKVIGSNERVCYDMKTEVVIETIEGKPVHEIVKTFLYQPTLNYLQGMRPISEREVE